jgi:hypothetical protein
MGERSHGNAPVHVCSFLDNQIGDLADAHLGWRVRDWGLEKVTIRELSGERIAGSWFAWISDIYFASVSLGPSGEPFSAPTQALAARAGSLESDWFRAGIVRPVDASRKLHRVRRRNR